MDALGFQFAGAAAVVAEVRIAAVDHDVALPEVRNEGLYHFVGHAGRDHDPSGAGLFEFRREFLERRCADRAFFDQGGDRIGMRIVNDAGMSVAHETANNVRAHAAESDHSELHDLVLC